MSATFVLIHGAGDVAWYWHRVEPLLRAYGHSVVSMELPVEDDAAGLIEYRDAVIAAIGRRRRNLVLVAQSFAGYVAPLVCEKLPVKLLVLVAAMVPRPGETAEEMFEHTRWKPGKHRGPRATYYHDVPRALADAALAHGRQQSETPGREPWPLDAWPEVPTRYLLCRNDRFFPRAWVRRVVRQRLGFEPDELESAHTPALSHPRQLAARLERYWQQQTL